MVETSVKNYSAWCSEHTKGWIVVDFMRVDSIRIRGCEYVDMLLFNVHVWLVISPWCLRKLNAVYMRVIHSIANQCRFDASCMMSDLEVRVMIE